MIRIVQIFLTVMIIAIPVMAANPFTLTEARKSFWDMGEKKITATEFFNKFQNQEPGDPVLMAYKGAAQAASAAQVSGVMNKLDAFKQGKKLIEKAVALSPKNWEVRFIRFTTQMNAPSMLGYNNMDEDRKFFLGNRPVPGTNADDRIFFNKALSYLIVYGKFDDKEKEILSNHKKQM